MAELTESNSNPTTLQIHDQIIGETIETNDYYFCNVGAAISVMSDGATYDLSNPPLKPLVVSQRFGLVFVAHDKGFCVAKTKDVIAAAKKSKAEGSGCSLQELSFVDVLIGRVSILAFSLDSELVAAVVGGEIRCFEVDSLLKKDKNLTFSCCVESNHVKDFLWIKETDPSFISLTDRGQLLLGVTNKSLKHVMDEVDAIGTSMDGSLVAVARRNVLSIHSQNFKEIIRMSLPIDNWAGENSTIKVDCIRWVRSDSIVVGCFQQTENGNEENYFLQVITSKDGQFIDDSVKLVSVDFNDLFTCLVDDIVPCGSGPYLLVNYLENCELAFLSNRKNTDEHVMLLNWSRGDNQVSLVYIDRDKWLPRIQLQENGDENLIFGLGVDESAVYENVKVSIGVEEERELPPHCVLVCLTLEGKLVMFYVASIAGSQCLSTASSYVQNMSVGPLVRGESFQLGEESSKQSALDLGLYDSDTKDFSSALDEVPIKKDQNSSAQIKDTLGNLNVDQNDSKEVDTGKSSQGAVLDVSNSNSFGHMGQSQEVNNLFSFSVPRDTVGTEKLKIGGGVPQTDKPPEKTLTSTGWGSQSSVLDVSNSKPFGHMGQSQEVKSNLFSFSVPGDTVGTENIKIGGGVPQTDKPPEKTLTSPRWGVEEKAGSRVLSNTSTPTTPGKSYGSSGMHSEKPLFSSQTFAKSIFSSSPLVSTDKSDSSGSLFGNFGSRPSDTFGSAGQVLNQSQKITSGSDVLGSALRNSSSKMQPQEVGKLQNITNQSAHPILGNDRKSSVRLGNTEHNLAKQFSNVHNMAKELDKLLESIKEAGGFREACTTAHRRSLEVLEEAMDSLSERNRACQSWTEERHREIQLLLDNTVQVLARKTHMDGIVRQTSDLQYWDLWNRQKLSSELEQKRNTLLNRNQELINQMIELEKHFNTLELNLFGESSGVNLISRTLNPRSTPSRHSQSLHAIHNATISQLAAAKQLSDSLSKQMAVLSIKSPPTKHTNVKKQVFDSIGIPYPDDSLHSPKTATAMDSPSNRLPLVTFSAEALNRSKKTHLSGVSSHDLETSRRRRDSLDRNLANFEAPKTTVKRIVVQNEIPKFGGLFSLRDKQSASPARLGALVGTSSKVVPVQDRNDRRDMPQKLDSGSHGTSNFKWPRGIPERSQAEPEQTPNWKLSQGDKISASNSTSSSSLSLSSFVDSNTKKDNSVSTPERPGIQIPNINRFDSSATTLSVSKPSLSQFGEGKSTSQQIQPPVFSFSRNSGQVPTSGIKKTESSKPFGGQNLSNVSTSKKDFETSTSSVFLCSSSASLPNPIFQTSPLTSVENESTATNTDMGKAVSEDGQFPSSPFSVSSSPTAPSSSLASKESKEASKFPTSVIPSASQAASVSSVSSKSTEIHTDSSGFSLSPVKEPIKIVPQAEPDKVSVENNMPSTLQSPEKLSPSPSSGLNFAQLTPSSSPTEVPKTVVSNPDLNKSVAPVSEVLNTPQNQFTADSSTPASLLELGGSTVGKTNIDTTVAAEDEMDEEAPETNQTVNQSLGSFGGFGLGSTPSSTALKSNPFGSPITSAPQNVASSVSLSVPSGELFRPASFSFPSMQPSQPSQSSSFGSPSGSFGFANPQQGPSGSGFGQPSQIGSQQSSSGSGFGQPSLIGSGQQALGSVLGSFGQSRQIGTGLPGSGFGAPASVGGFAAISSTGGGFGGGFATAATSGGGFAAAATGGGFAAAAPAAGGGFAAAAPAAGGFASVAPTGGGFAAATPSGSGFAAAAGGGGGFGAFGKPGGSGFSGFGGGGVGGRQAPPELFTQMRK